MRATSCLFLLAALAACHKAHPAAGPAAGPVAPAQIALRPPDRIDDAVSVWRCGEAFFKQERWQAEESVLFLGEPETFQGFDLACMYFLQYPDLQPAVQFSCAIRVRTAESRLKYALSHPDRYVRLQALVLLMRVRAPSSVCKQFVALTGLRTSETDSRARALLEELGSCFAPSVLLQRMKSIRSACDAEWLCMAVGMLGIREALPYLTEAAEADLMPDNLAAERAIERFEGVEADRALAATVAAWHYSVSMHAAEALLKRSPDLLHDTLRSSPAPESLDYFQGLYLARLNDPSAVPILCRTVGKVGIIDDEMFQHIGRLAAEEHRAIVENLPTLVRPEQRAMAEGALAAFTERIKK